MTMGKVFDHFLGYAFVTIHSIQYQTLSAPKYSKFVNIEYDILI